MASASACKWFHATYRHNYIDEIMPECIYASITPQSTVYPCLLHASSMSFSPSPCILHVLLPFSMHPLLHHPWSAASHPLSVNLNLVLKLPPLLTPHQHSPCPLCINESLPPFQHPPKESSVPPCLVESHRVKTGNRKLRQSALLPLFCFSYWNDG